MNRDELQFSKRQFGWFVACVAVLTAAVWIVVTGPAACEVMKGCSRYNCERDCSDLLDSCKRTNDTPSDLDDCRRSYGLCIDSCNRRYYDPKPDLQKADP